MNISKSWVELEIWFEVFGEEKLNLHGVSRSVVQDDALTVKLLVYEHV